MLKPEYIRDMNNNYMVFKGEERGASSYGIKMLLNNTIPGILRMELRCIDTLGLYYYDITSLKSIYTVYERESLSYHAIRNLTEGILNIIKSGSEYLLSENDYLITPEYIFMDANENIRLCHIVGLCEDFFSQYTRLLEFLLNKVDYKEEAAVLLVYALYKESRESDTTFDKLQAILKKQFTNEILVKKITMEGNNQSPVTEEKTASQITQKTDSSRVKNTSPSNQEGLKNTEESSTRAILGKSFNILGNGINKQRNSSAKQKEKSNKSVASKEHKDKNNKSKEYSKPQKEKASENNKASNINKSNYVNGVEVENQKEFQYYGAKAFFLGGISLLGGIIILIVGFIARLFQNNMGTGIDPVKLLSCIVVLFCLEGYIITKIFDPKNKQIKYVPLLEYTKTQSEPFDGSIEILKGGGQMNEYKIPEAPREHSQIAMLNLYNNQCTQNHENQQKLNKTEIHIDSIANCSAELNDDNETAVVWENYSRVEDTEKTVILADLTPVRRYYIIQIFQSNMSEFDNLTDTEEKQKLLGLNETSTSKKITGQEEEEKNINASNLVQVCVEINKFPFCIGKQEKGNQLVIKNNAISRKHGVITKDGEKLYLTDLHSTNGCFVNGKRLFPNQPLEIKEFDEIRFSNLLYKLTVIEE